MAKATQTEGEPEIEEAKDSFSLDPRPDQSLSQLADAGDFDDIHFFVQEALESGAVDDEATGADTSFALVPYDHPEEMVDDDSFEMLEEAGYRQASLRDLLNFAIEKPQVQRDYDVVALGDLRTRQVYEDRRGETIWEPFDEAELDKSVCQWATGLGELNGDRTLIPVEIYLDDLLVRDTLMLVREA